MNSEHRKHFRKAVEGQPINIPPSRFDNRWACIDCGLTPSPFFMVHDKIWNTLMGYYRAGILCPKCFETRLGRRIEYSDLKPNDEIQILNALVHHMVVTGALHPNS